MIKKILFLFLLLSGLAEAQTITAVSATVTDPAGNAYKNGTYYVSLVDSAGNSLSNTPVNIGGIQQTLIPQSGTLSAAGAFSVSLYANAGILSPTGTAFGTQWKFYICSQAPTPATLTGKSLSTIGLIGPQVCFTSTQTISGSTQSLTSTLSSASTSQSPVSVIVPPSSSSGSGSTILPSGDTTCTTDSAAVQAIATAGGVATLGSGTFYIDNVSATGLSFAINGQGPQNTIITKCGATNYVFTVNPAGWNCNGCTTNVPSGYTFRGFTINQKNGVTPTAGGSFLLESSGGANFYATDVHIENTTSNGVWNGIDIEPNTYINYVRDNIVNVPVNRCLIYNSPAPGGDNDISDLSCRGSNGSVLIRQADTMVFTNLKINGGSIIFDQSGIAQRVRFVNPSIEDFGFSVGCNIDFGTGGTAPAEIQVIGGELGGATQSLCHYTGNNPVQFAWMFDDASDGLAATAFVQGGYMFSAGATGDANIQTATQITGVSVGTVGGFPAQKYIYAGGSLNQKVNDFFSNNTTFNGRFVNDANNSANNWLTVTRSGFVPQAVVFGAPVKATNTVQLVADTGNITATSAATATTVFTLPTLQASTNYSVHCSGTTTQATAGAGIGISIQTATTAATDMEFHALVNTAPTAINGQSSGLLSTTTQSAIYTGVAGTLTTQLPWTVDGSIEVGATVPTAVTIGFFSANASDAVVVKRDSYCTVLP